MATPEKPQPSPEQVAVVDAALRIIGSTKTWLKPMMYPSGSMLLMVITEAGKVLVARIARDGSTISVS